MSQMARSEGNGNGCPVLVLSCGERLPVGEDTIIGDADARLTVLDFSRNGSVLLAGSCDRPGAVVEQHLSDDHDGIRTHWAGIGFQARPGETIRIVDRQHRELGRRTIASIS